LGHLLILLFIILFLNNENLFNDVIENYFIMNFHYGFQKSIDDNIILKILRSIYVNFKDKYLSIITNLSLIILNIYLILCFVLKKKIKEFFELITSKQSAIFIAIFIFDLLSILVSHIFEVSYKSLIPSMLILNLFLLTKIELNNLIKLKIFPILFLILISLYLNYQKIIKKNFNNNDILLIKGLNHEINKDKNLDALAIGSLGSGTVLFMKTDLINISNFHFTPFIHNYDILDPIYQNYLRKIKNKKPKYIILNPFMFGTFWGNKNEFIKEITFILKEKYEPLKIKTLNTENKELKMFKNTSLYVLK
jgi:hypothetical protein